MTLPNKEAGLATFGLEFAFTNDGSIPGAIDRTQNAITEVLKGQMFESGGWQTAHTNMFTGLPAGVPYTLGMLMKLAEMLTGLPITEWGAPTLDKITDVFNAIGTFMARLTSMFGNLDFLAGGPWEVGDRIQQWIEDTLLPPGLLASWQELYARLTGDITGGLEKLGDLLGGGLFGPITPGRLSLLPTGLIGDLQPNLLEDPDFKSDTFNGGGVFIRDTTTGYGGSFSAYTDANGTLRELLSKNKLTVVPGQTFTLRVRTKWTGGAGTGTPIRLGVTEYNAAGDAVGQPNVVVRSISPAGTDFVEMTGTYTVPETNVTGLRMRFGISSAATAGRFHWSKTEMRPTRKLPRNLIDGLEDALSNLFGGLNDALEGLLEKAGISDFLDLKNVLGGPLGNGLAAIEDRLNDFLHSGSPLNADLIAMGNVADEFVQGLFTINGNIFTKLTNIFKPDNHYSHDDAQAALAQVTYAAVDTSARLAQLEQTLTGGVSEGDDFERVSSTSLGSGWITIVQGGAGVWATPNGHDASFATSGVANRDFLCIRNTGHIRSSTIYQRVSMIIGSTAGQFNDDLFGTFNFTGHNDLWLRISDATTSFANVTGIRVRFGGDGSASICRFINGINVDASTAFVYRPPGSLGAPGPGSMIWGEAGTPGTARYFRAGIGTSTHMEITEVGVASGADGTTLRWGHGGRAEGHILPLPGQQKPGSVHQWNAKDLLL